MSHARDKVNLICQDYLHVLQYAADMYALGKLMVHVLKHNLGVVDGMLL